MKKEEGDVDGTDLLALGLTASGTRVLSTIAEGLQPGVAATLNDIWRGLIGDRVRQWQTRRLVLALEGTAEFMKKRGIDLQKARPLPNGELYLMFDGAAKCDDDEVTALWSGLLASALDPDRQQEPKTRIVNVLSRLDGESVILFRLLAEFRRARATDFDPELTVLSAAKQKTADEQKAWRERIARAQQASIAWTNEASELLWGVLEDHNLTSEAEQEAATLTLRSLGLIRARPREVPRQRDPWVGSSDPRDAPAAVSQLDKDVRKIITSENDRESKPAFQRGYYGVQRNYLLTRLGISVSEACGLDVKSDARLD